MQRLKHTIMMVEPLGDGGLAHYSFNLAHSLVEEGVEVLLYTSSVYELRDYFKGFALIAEMFKATNFIIRKIPILNVERNSSNLIRRLLKLLEYPKDVIKLIVCCQRKNVNLVHLQSVNEIELIMILLLKAFNFKTIFTIHNIRPRHGDLKGYHNLAYRLIYKLANGLFVHSINGKNEVSALFKVKASKVHYVPHGNYSFFKNQTMVTLEAAKKELAIPLKSFVILFFGAIRPNKGLDLLLNAMPLIIKEIPEAKLLIAGEICGRFDMYQSIIDELSLKKHVLLHLHYVPFETVHKYFIAVDVVVLPYREITQSGVLQVAYAFGKPVVASRIDGFCETVEDGLSGLLFDDGDYYALSKCIVKIAKDISLRKRMAKRALDLSVKSFSWAKIAKETIRVYDKIASQNKL